MEQFKEVNVKEIPFNKGLKDAMAQVPKGAFLTVSKDNKTNVMTIGWATSGIMWGRPVFVIGVRPSRYTYKLIDMGDEFSVSVPLDQKLKKQLGFCGSNSGRDLDKFEAGDITPFKGQGVKVPVVGECDLHFECRVVAKHQLVSDYIDDNIKNRYYPEGDYHMIFYGEIIKAYKIVD